MLYINYGENVTADTEYTDKYTIELYPKTIETAVKLAKEKNRIKSDYLGNDIKYIMGDIDIYENLDLLSKISEDPKIRPVDIAYLKMDWYEKHGSKYRNYDYELDCFDDPNFEENYSDFDIPGWICEKLLKKLKKYLKRYDIDVNDFTYAIKYEDTDY